MVLSLKTFYGLRYAVACTNEMVMKSYALNTGTTTEDVIEEIPDENVNANDWECLDDTFGVGPEQVADILTKFH